ncbi:MAG: peptidylprolyl isomerase [Alphaproteobacteria bacterium]|nr:MAG: peptidylprolyl isomerase [Alphaproteobacteria bacterium]TAF75492.1 MAG: peptidylprolyl isomerase [Alphaproteobacteria bacterium]
MRTMMKLCAVLMMGMFMNNAAMAADPENIVLIETKYGTIVAELFPEKAPNHVARIKELARKKFYDGVLFHRVIDGFMAQTGDPTGTGTGNSDLPDLKAEFNDMRHERGVLSMARSGNPNSANSQFFIMLEAAPHLDRQYTAFGRVVSGMEFVDKIKKGDAASNGSVQNPDKMISVRVAADVQKTDPAPKAN